MLSRRLLFIPKLILLWFILQSCTCTQQHAYYAPPVQNVPMITDSAEYTFTGGICGKPGRNLDPFDFQNESGASGFFLQGAYSPKKHWAFSANMMKVSQKESCSYSSGSTQTNTSGEGKGYAFDAGLGYYTTADLVFRDAKKPGLLSHFLFDIYAGIGQSTQRHSYQDGIYAGSSRLDALVFYVQPTFGIKTKQYAIGATVRVNSFYFYNITTHYPSNYGGSNYADVEIANINFLVENQLQPFLEPSLTFRAGFKWCMLQFQYVYCEPFRKMKSNSYEATKVVVGFHVNINPKFRK